MTNQPDTSKQGWEERFDEEFTYSDENEDQWFLQSFDEENNKNSDLIPEIKSFIHQEIDRAVKEVFDMLGSGQDLFLEWREYVQKQYDNPERETQVIDSFEYWLDRKIDLIKFKIKNG